MSHCLMSNLQQLFFFYLNLAALYHLIAQPAYNHYLIYSEMITPE